MLDIYAYEGSIAIPNFELYSGTVVRLVAANSCAYGDGFMIILDRYKILTIKLKRLAMPLYQPPLTLCEITETLISWVITKTAICVISDNGFKEQNSM
jgi:hypothetical protein